MKPDLVIFSFSNEAVRNLDFAASVKVYGESSLPAGPALKSMQGKLLVSVEGYDDDLRGNGIRFVRSDTATGFQDR